MDDNRGSNEARADERQAPTPVRSSEEAPMPARPTPVREALERAAPSRPPEAPVPTRTVVDEEGRTWQARLVGRTRSGRPADPGVDLALLTFHEVADSDADDRPDGSGDPPPELLLPLLELQELSDAELLEALDRARVPTPSPEGFFADTRRGGR